MDSARLHLDYVLPLTAGGCEHSVETLSGPAGLRYWLHDHDSQPLRLLSRMPWRRLVVLGLLAGPAMLLTGWIHETGSGATTAETHSLPSAGYRSAPAFALSEIAPVTAPIESLEPTTVGTPPPLRWAPQRHLAEQQPSDYLPVPEDRPITVTVVTIRARVTAYTPYDHARSHPAWADGLVAWHPGGKKRQVSLHRYCLATDWSQFPPGATFIHVPGYMPQSFPSFPECFRVVDDACGAARKARRRGQQPVIDVRYMTKYSAIGGESAWGTRQLDVEVIFPAGYRIPVSLRPWVQKVEERTYGPDGTRLVQPH